MSAEEPPAELVEYGLQNRSVEMMMMIYIYIYFLYDVS